MFEVLLPCPQLGVGRPFSDDDQVGRPLDELLHALQTLNVQPLHINEGKVGLQVFRQDVVHCVHADLPLLVEHVLVDVLSFERLGGLDVGAACVREGDHQVGRRLLVAGCDGVDGGNIVQVVDIKVLDEDVAADLIRLEEVESALGADDLSEDHCLQANVRANVQHNVTFFHELKIILYSRIKAISSDIHRDR